MKKKLLVLLCALTACCLMGCEPNYIDKKQEKSTVKKAEAFIIEFLDDNLESDYTLKDLDMIVGEKRGSSSELGRYGTNFVKATFVTEGLTYNICADTERDLIYWDYEFYNLGEIIQYELAEVIDLKGAEFIVPKANFCIEVTSSGIISTHDKDTSPISTYCDISNVAPANLTKSEQQEWVDHLLSDGNAAISIQYHADELGTIDTNLLQEVQTTFPGITSLNLYNVPTYEIAFWNKHHHECGGYPIDITEEYVLGKTNATPASPPEFQCKHYVRTKDEEHEICVNYISLFEESIGDDRTTLEYSSPLYFNEDGAIGFREPEGRAFIYWKEKPSYSYLVEGSKKYEIGKLNNNCYSAKSDFSEAGVFQACISQVYKVE